MNKRINFGFSSILLSFVMISIVTFSALALVTSHSDLKLSNKVALRNTQYYEAEHTANQYLQVLDESLLTAYQDSYDRSSYYKEADFNIALLSCGPFTAKENHTYTFQVGISDNQVLQVDIEILYPMHDDDAFYRILRWQSINTQETLEEQPLNLLGT